MCILEIRSYDNYMCNHTLSSQPPFPQFSEKLKLPKFPQYANDRILNWSPDFFDLKARTLFIAPCCLLEP